MGFWSTIGALLSGDKVQPGTGRLRLPRDWWKVDGALALKGGGSIEVVGESYRQEVFERVVGPRWREGVYWHVVAQIVFVEDNVRDPQAVGVMIDGALAGYLPRRDAAAFRQSILAINPEEKPVICKGEIRGGFLKGAERGQYGLVLDVKQPLQVRVR